MALDIRTSGKIFMFVSSVVLLQACHTNDTADLPASSSAGMAAFKPGVPGGISTNTSTVTALVTAVDYKKRTVTLKNNQGEERTLKIGPAATNFNQIAVGDHVTVEVAEEMAIYMRDKNVPDNDGSAGIIAKAPYGAKPAVVFADTTEITAVVKAVDLAKHTATLQFDDGSSKTVAVRQDVTLNKKQVGEKVVFRLTSAMGISVAPAK